jgi:hypothetical protein
VSWSGVLHAPNAVKPWMPRGTDLSVSYNRAQNFRPSSTIADVYGRPFSPPSGKTKDMGVTIYSSFIIPTSVVCPTSALLNKTPRRNPGGVRVIARKKRSVIT